MPIFSRLELYDLIWSKPLRDVASDYGVSDVALSQTCATAGIPRPPRGYWAKLNSGRRVHKAALPPRPIGMIDAVELGATKGGGHSRPALVRHGILPEPSDTLEQASLRIEQAVRKAMNGDIQREWHPSIEQIPARDRKFSRWIDELDEKHAKLPRGMPLHIEYRRLRIVNSVLCAAQGMGAKCAYRRSGILHQLELKFWDTPVYAVIEPLSDLRERWWSWKPENLDNVTAFENPLCFLIFEDRMLAPSSQFLLVPRDEAVRSAARRLVEFAAVEAESRARRFTFTHNRRLRGEDLEWNKQQAELQRANAEYEEEIRASIAEHLRKELVRQSGSFADADQIRAYVLRIRSNDSSHSPDVLESWCDWALEEADRIDPLLNGDFHNSLKSWVNERNFASRKLL